MMNFTSVPINELETSFTSSDDLQEAFLKFNRMLIDKVYCDVTIITTTKNGTKSYLDAHRMVLDARIPYFSALFRNEPGKQACFL